MVNDSEISPDAAEVAQPCAQNGERAEGAREGNYFDHFLHGTTPVRMAVAGTHGGLAAEDECALARRARAGDFAARQKLLAHSLSLVIQIAKHYASRGLSMVHLIEVGNLGLMDALRKFDPERRVRFATYAAWWISQNIELAHVRGHAAMPRIPMHALLDLNLYLRARRHLEANGALMPEADEVAYLVGKPPEAVRKVLTLHERIGALDEPLGPEAMR
ncbi:MAG: sigma factor [Betaproteobacteria bacterium]|nr:sigma factor [Betaproteobacteria bacterium]